MVYMGCGKVIRLKRTHGLRKRLRLCTQAGGKEIGIGDIYLDCNYHPVVCTEIDDWDIAGISMVDGSGPRSCSIRHCGIQKLTKEETDVWINAWKTGGLWAAMKLRGWNEEDIDKFMKDWRENLDGTP
jgi:hypothetical protein